MAVVTRIGIAHLVKSRVGSVELPQEITLFCPQCGTEAADKGNCLLSLVSGAGASKTGFIVKLVVDCRICGCDGEAPAVRF